MTDAYAYGEGPADQAMEPMGEPMEGPMADVVYMAPQKGPPKAVQRLIDNARKPNLADDIEASELARMGAKVCDEFKLDEQSRTSQGWDLKIKTAMDLAMLVAKEKSYPWPQASNVMFPTIATAAVQFNARAYPAVIDGANIVKGKVLGQSTPEKQQRAERVGRYMSYQLLEEMDGWEDETDKLMIMLPIVGCVFRKTWFDPMDGYNCSELVAPDKLVVNYWAKSLRKVPRVTHVLDDVYPHQAMERMRSGIWRTVDLGRPVNDQNDDSAPHTFLEQHRLWDLDGDEYPEPYVVTVHKETQQVVRVVASYDEDAAEYGSENSSKAAIVYKKGKIVRIRPVQSFTKYGFIPAPDGSFYDIGFGTLLGPLSNTINSTINQLMDAGHLANTGGGFLGQGASLKAGNVRFIPGEWKKVEITGASLRENIVPLPTTQPSAVLFNLLGMLIEATKDVTATQDILTGDSGRANMPVGTTLAMIEQGLKTFTAIVKRIHRALKHELGCLYRLNSLYLQPQVYFVFQDVEGAVAQEDFAADDIDVVPVSDPTMATDMQRLGRAQFLQTFRPDPLMDGRKINKRVLEAAQIEDVDDLFAPEQPPPPDPKVVEAAAKAHEAAKQTTIDAARADADIALKDAQTQQITAQTAMMGPEFILAIQQMVDARMAHLEGREDAQAAQQGMPNGEQVQPGDAGPMAEQPPHPDFPPVPQGPPGDVGPPMDVGPAVDPGFPGAGGPPGGPAGPEF